MTPSPSSAALILPTAVWTEPSIGRTIRDGTESGRFGLRALSRRADRLGRCCRPGVGGLGPRSLAACHRPTPAALPDRCRLLARGTRRRRQRRRCGDHAHIPELERASRDPRDRSDVSGLDRRRQDIGLYRKPVLLLRASGQSHRRTADRGGQPRVCGRRPATGEQLARKGDHGQQAATSAEPRPQRQRKRTLSRLRTGCRRQRQRRGQGPFQADDRRRPLPHRRLRQSEQSLNYGARCGRRMRRTWAC